MGKGKNLGLNRGASLKSLPNGTEQRENDRKDRVCKLPFLPFKFNRLNANTVFEPGKIANLVLLKNSPLESVDAYDSIVTVWVHGNPISRDSLAVSPNK